MNQNSPGRNVPAAIAVVAALLVCYAGVVAGIVRVWSTNYLYSYGFAVPLITAYMLWTRWDEVRQVQRGPDYLPGALITGAGIILLLIGHLGAVESVEQVSVVVAALGSTLLLFGRGVFRVAWFPIAYLILAVPVWDRVFAYLQSPSQQISASIAVRMIRLAGVPAIQDHTFVMLPNVTLEVLRECSGVNQLISVATMALAASYIWLKSIPRRVMLVAFSVAVAYFSNGARIALVGVLGYNDLASGRVGVLHLMEGLAVSLLGYAVIFACLSFLSKANVRQLQRDVSASTTASLERGHRLALPRLASVDVAVVMLLLGAGVFRATFHAPAVLLNSDLGSLPAQIDEWFVDSAPDSRPAFRLARADNELLRVYRHPSGDTIRLYVGYHQYQTEGKELIDGRKGAPAGLASHIRLSMPPETFQLNQVVQQAGGAQTGVLFWYDVNGRILSDLYVAKGYTVWDAVTRGRTNAALVMIEWTGSSRDDFERSRERVLEFADSVVRLLRGYLPTQHAGYVEASP